MSFQIFISNRESGLWHPSPTLRPLRGSDNKRVSGFGTLCLCPNPRLSARTSDTRNPLSEMPDAPRLGIEGENNGIGGIPKRK